MSTYLRFYNLMSVIATALMLVSCSTELDRNSPFDNNSAVDTQKKGEITGKVTLEGESDHAGIEIRLVGPSKVDVSTQANGDFALNGLIPGSYKAIVSLRGFVEVTLPTEISIGGLTTLDPVVLALRTAEVVGLVTTSDSQEVSASGALVNIVRKYGPRSGSSAVHRLSAWFASAESNESGSAPMPQQVLVGTSGNYSFRSVPAGAYTLTVIQDGAAPVSTEFTVTGDSTLVYAEALELRPLTGAFEIVGKLADGTTKSNDYTTVQAVTLNLFGFNASQMELGEQDDEGDCQYGAVTTFAAHATYNLSSGDGLKTVCVRFIDAQGNRSEEQLSRIILDTIPPVLSVLRVNGGFEYSKVANVPIELVGIDRGSGLASFQYSVDGAAAITVDYVPALDFTFTEGAHSYALSLVDRAGNVGVATTKQAGITIDTIKPLITQFVVAGGAISAAPGNVTVAIGWTDASPAMSMKLVRTGDIAGGVYVVAVNQTEVSIPSADGTYSYTLILRDEAGNESVVSESQSILVDATPPTLSSVSLNSTAALTSSTLVNLTLSASGATQMRVSESPMFAGSSWVAVSSPLGFTLSPGDGNKTVYAQFRDAAGNVAEATSDSIILDTITPSGTIAIASNSAYTQSQSVQLDLTAFDSGSGVAALGIKLANRLSEIATTAPVAFVSPKTHTLVSGQGLKTVYYQVLDVAGNASAVVSDTITRDSVSPTGGAIDILAVATNQSVTDATITLPVDATLMKISHGNNDCSGGIWTSTDTAVSILLDGSNITQYASVQFQDVAGNTSVCTWDSVLVDTIGPTASVFTSASTGSPVPPAGYSKSSTVRLDWDTTAADCNLIQLSEDIGFLTIDASSTDCTANFVGAFNFAPAYDGIHTVYARMRDAAGNWGPLAALTVIVDTSVPSVPAGGFAIAQGNFTNSSAITLSHGVSGATKYRAVQSGTCNGVYGTLGASTGFTLTGIDGAKTVSVQYSDDASNVTACYSRSITLDTSLPTVSATLTGAEAVAGRTAQQVVTLNLTLSSDAYEMRLSNLAGFPGVPWQATAPAMPWALFTGDGLKSIYVQVRDRAGNLSTVSTPNITLDQTAPNAPALQIIDINGDGFALSVSDVELSWSASGDPNLQGYELEVFVEGQGTGFELVASVAPSDTSYTADVTQTAGHNHNFRIRAMDDLGNYSSYSNFATARPIQSIEEVCLVGRDEDFYDVNWQAPSGTFSIASEYHAHDVTGNEFKTVLPENLLVYEYAKPADSDAVSWSSHLQLVTANQDNTIRYRVDYPLPSKRIEVLASEGQVGDTSEIEIDSSGNIHIVFKDSGHSDFRYTTNKTGMWVTTSLGFGNNASLALDNAGNAHISFFYGDQLRYVTNKSGTWVETFIENMFGNAFYTSIGVDSLGKAHIAYYNFSTADLKFATNSSGAWIVSTLDSADLVGTSPSLALDPSGVVYISYWDSTNADLKLATNKSGFWATSIIDGNSAGIVSSLVVDANYTLHVSYQYQSAQDLKYATKTEFGAWVLTNIDTANDAGDFSSIDVDKNGKVHIAYFEDGNDDLRYATNASGSWETSLLDPTNNAGANHSLRVDRNGKIHVSYRETPNWDLKYLTNASGSWEYSWVDSPNWSTPSSLAIDRRGSPYIAYQSNGSTLKLAKKNSSGIWQRQTVDPTVGAGESLSLTVSESGMSYIAYLDNSVSDLKFATDESGAWQITTVDSVGTVGYDAAIARDKNGKIHISYVDEDLTVLKYATNQTGSWVPEIADSTPDVGYGSAITLDAGGSVHIVYFDNTTDDLKYAKKSGAVWTTTTLFSQGDAGWANSIAVDSKGFLHIAHYRGSGNDVLYTTNQTGPWVTLEVESTISAIGPGLKLALDTKDKVHLAYRGISDSSLRYSTNASGGWKSYELDNDGNSGWYPSLKVDDKNQVNLSFANLTYFNLYYMSFYSGCSTASGLARIGAWE